MVSCGKQQRIEPVVRSTGTSECLVCGSTLYSRNWGEMAYQVTAYERGLLVVLSRKDYMREFTVDMR